MNLWGLAAYAARAWTPLTVVVFIGTAGLLASGYRATHEWEQGVTTRIAHQTEENADLILTAINRDMRGAQARILANRDWEVALALDADDPDMTEQVATTFARYPYPESFFTWQGGTQRMTFFSRSTRLPQWMPAVTHPVESPIAVAMDPPAADTLRKHLESAVASQQRYAVLNTALAGVPYQVVARMAYSDPLREHIESVSGFTVNLDWVRQHYFADILAELGPAISGGLRQDVSLLDEHDHLVVGSNADGPPTAVRRFPLVFVDTSDAAPYVTEEISQPTWLLRLSASNDPILLSAHRRVDTTLFATVVAVAVCGISLVLGRKAITNDARLVEMRSRFVSSVTHDLKTPLANIHALSATLERESQITSERYKQYPHLLVQEATSLGRMVDNLLAYARITDVTEAYAFEPFSAAELADEAVRSFTPQLSDDSVAVKVDAPGELLFVRADQRAMVLALRNLVDNALRHARRGGSRVTVSIASIDANVLIRVADDGSGMTEKKLKALRESIASKAFAPSDGGGLGLAIASKIIADHRGTLSVDSTPGRGTVCTVGLPGC